MATHSSILAWRIPGTEEPSGLPSMGSHRVGHDWSDLTAAMPSKSICGVANVSLLESLQNFSNFNVHVTYLGILLRCRLCFGKLQVGQTFYISNKCLELQEALVHEAKCGRSYKIYFKIRMMQSWWEILVRWLCPKSIFLLRSLGTLNAHHDWFSSVCFPRLFSLSKCK